MKEELEKINSEAQGKQSKLQKRKVTEIIV